VCPGDPRKYGQVGFDARDGSRFGSSHLDASDVHVSVVVYNKNPFLYEYRLAIATTPTDVSRVKEFFAAAGLKTPESALAGCDLGGELEKAGKARTTFDGVVAANPQPTCNELYLAAKAVIDTARDLSTAWAANPACKDSGAETAVVKEREDAAGKLLDALVDRERFWESVNVSIPDEPTTATMEHGDRRGALVAHPVIRAASCAGAAPPGAFSSPPAPAEPPRSPASGTGWARARSCG
jgi:hypothetical protein